MGTYQEKKVTINGVQLGYLHDGKNDKTPLLFLHGALADCSIWHPHLLELESIVSPMALSLRHFGASGKSGEFGIETHADDVIAAVRELDIAPIHLVAWSYGADVALLAVLKAPELFHSLFLYEPGYPSHLEAEEFEQFMVDAQKMFGPLFEQSENMKPAEMVETLIDGSSNRKGYFISQPETLRLNQLAQADTIAKQLNQTERPDINADTLATITLPVYMAYGENSRPLFQLVSASVARNIPDCQTEIISGVTHMFPVEDPIAFSAKIVNFIRIVP
ncbi:alpha/beta fold hydrolase [Xenorhabdus szentirmaii]|uniref:Hydrolase protein n=1 Tax=Xenorhabdus szentirmaii DSM 16338 TaxID=1427518 RepID=W1J2K1_9GAMM|nr:MULTISPECIES: alpha/beta hydrolase [Xenorhabdus]MBD2806247.1 alpha/beta hydrolase [Xenorhabdus sp. ZM]PHM31856.1 2-succinate hydrolase [Xenorhabdus szentirmaii DSM 16338]PHM41751.1 2-succinate hydrolase [Xenorhabdus szentirmaii]CDL84939.1 putative hydrolase protein [Xenorhabdus szentirmaii DSM 16338]